MLKIDLKIEESNDQVSFEEKHIKLVEESAFLLEKIVNSDQFMVKVTGSNLRRPKRFRRSNKLSRLQIYNTFMSGNDLFSNESIHDSNEIGDKDIDVWIHPYRTKPAVVGYTTPKTHATWINLNKLDQWIERYSLRQDYLRAYVAGNLAHEYCHNLGFTHGRGGSTRANMRTVPYFIGNTVRDIAKVEANLSALGIDSAVYNDLFSCSAKAIDQNL